MQDDLIIISDYCHDCHIDPSFIAMLNEEGLIEIHDEADQQYILLDQLPELERYTRLYYELSISPGGIDAINSLLERMASMRNEITLLRAQLDVYERFAFEELEE